MDLLHMLHLCLVHAGRGIFLEFIHMVKSFPQIYTKTIQCS